MPVVAIQSGLTPLQPKRASCELGSIFVSAAVLLFLFLLVSCDKNGFGVIGGRRIHREAFYSRNIWEGGMVNSDIDIVITMY